MPLCSYQYQKLFHRCRHLFNWKPDKHAVFIHTEYQSCYNDFVDAMALFANDNMSNATWAAEWISDVLTSDGSVSALCIHLDMWMPAGFDVELLYLTNDDNVTNNLVFLSFPPNIPFINYMYEVSLPEDASLYQIVIYCNIPNLQVGQEAGYIRDVTIDETSCLANSKNVYIITIVITVHNFRTFCCMIII